MRVGAEGTRGGPDGGREEEDSKHSERGDEAEGRPDELTRTAGSAVSGPAATTADKRDRAARCSSPGAWAPA